MSITRNFDHGAKGKAGNEEAARDLERFARYLKDIKSKIPVGRRATEALRAMAPHVISRAIEPVVERMYHVAPSLLAESSDTLEEALDVLVPYINPNNESLMHIRKLMGKAQAQNRQPTKDSVSALLRMTKSEMAFRLPDDSFLVTANPAYLKVRKSD